MFKFYAYMLLCSDIFCLLILSRPTLCLDKLGKYVLLFLLFNNHTIISYSFILFKFVSIN